MIYDCFTFFNELDLLEIRLNILKDVVDRFIVVEATQTHQGAPKPLLLQENIARFAPFKGKLIHVIADNPPSSSGAPRDANGNNWVIENWQRAKIDEALQNCQDDDVIIVSDLDEIPRPEAILRNRTRPGITTLCVDNYNFFLDFRSSEPPFPVVKMVRYDYYRDVLPRLPFPENQKFRFLPCYWETSNPNKLRAMDGDRLVPHGGWHFSYLGGLERVLQKRQSIVEQQYNDAETTTAQWVSRRIRQGRDIYRRGYLFYPTARSLPNFLRRNRKRYDHLFWHPSAPWERSLLTMRFMLLRLCNHAVRFGRRTQLLTPFERLIPIIKRLITR